MRILITTPFFQFAGGSELETIHTANAFASFLEVQEVCVFVYGGYDLNFIKNIDIDEKIKFFNRPSFLSYKYVHRLNKKLKNILSLESLPFDYLYWKFKFFIKYDKVYIITKTTLNYYVPIIKQFKSKKNILVKFTTVFFDSVDKVSLKYLAQVKYNIVTSEKQKIFFIKNLYLDNTVAQEILLFNENYCLTKTRIKKDSKLYDFGILGRFSEEKQFEHAINVIANLRNIGRDSTLIIKGGCDKGYFRFLSNLVINKKLEDLVTLVYDEVPYDMAYDFFDNFNCFLITSKYEGGPNVGLEIMAYGLPILSYDVGAMTDRLLNFREFIATDENDLTKKATDILNYNDDEFVEICIKVKKEYINKFSNNLKISFLRDFLN